MEEKELKELITLGEEVKNKIEKTNLPADTLHSVEGHVNELIDLAKNEELNVKSVKTPEELKSITEEIQKEVESEVEIEGKMMEGVEEELQKADDLDKKNYTKITPTFYVKPLETEELDAEGEKIELFQILNPETGVVEKRVLNDEEKHEIIVQQLKSSRIKFRPIKYATKTIGTSVVVSSIGRERHVKNKEIQTNVIVNQFGADYRKKRQRKNKMAKASRKVNRK